MHFAYVGPATTWEEALDRLVRTHHDYITCDTETIALGGKRIIREDDERVERHGRTPIGIGVATSPDEAYYFPLGEGKSWPNVPAVDTTPLEYVLSRRRTTKVFFNAPYDLGRIEEAFDFEAYPFLDVSIATKVQGLPNSLEENIGELQGLDHPVISDILPKAKTMLDVPYEDTAWKCLRDCMATYRLFDQVRLREWKDGPLTWKDWTGRTYDVTKEIIDCHDVDTKMIYLLRRMTKRGIKVNQERVDYWYKKLSGQIFELKDIFDMWGVDPGSNYQLGFALAQKGHYLPLTKSGKQLQVNEDILLKLDDPMALTALSYRKRVKLRSTYVTPNRTRERVHSEFRLDLSTGRLASSNPNLQNVPGDNYQGLKPAGAWNMRDILAPDTGVFTWFDDSQIEMRIMAHQSQDPVLLDAYRTGVSVHEITLHTLWPGKTKKGDPDFYTQAKTFNFANIYLATAQTLSEHTGLPVEVCARFQRIWYDKYAGVWAYLCEQQLWDKPWVATDFGRRCRLPVLAADRPDITPDHINKCKVSYADQGTGADIIKRQMLWLDMLGADMILQVHDEVILDGDWERMLGVPDEDGLVRNHVLARIHPEMESPFEVHKGAVWS